MKRFISALSSLCLAATSVVSAFPMLVSAAGSASWTIAEKTVDAGFDVAVPVTIDGDEGTAGFVVNFTYDEALTFNGFTWGDAYTGEAVLNDNELYVVWADDNGNDQTAADGATVVTLNFTAPDAAGRYPVEFVTMDVVDTNEERLTITEQDGAVIVRESIAPGSAGWDIGEEYVDGGAEVAVPVTVIGDEGTAGFIADFAYNENLTFTGITWGSAYTGEAVINEDELRVVWADDNGNDQIADEEAVVLYLNFVAPEEAGEYEVTFTELVAVNTDGGELTLEQANGAVIVEENIPEAGAADWDIAEETVAAGAEVALPVYILNDGGSAGFVVNFAYDEALTYNGITWGESYTGEAVINGDELRVVWADDNGENQNAASESVVLYLNFVAPTGAGEYPVTFTELTVVDTYGQPLTLTQENGAVIVAETTTETTTTTTETTTTTTETTTTTSDTTTTTSGETTTTTSDTTTTTSGETTTTTSDTTTTTSGETTTTTSETTTTTSDETTTTTSETTTTTSGETTTTTSETTTTTSGETTTTTSETTTTTSGETTTTTSETTTTTSGETTTTTTETTTTSSDTTTTTTETTTTTSDTTTTTTVSNQPINPGHAVYQIDDVNGIAGTTVRVPVLVWYDEGTAGLTMQFSVPEGFTISGYEFGNAYIGAEQAVWNPDEYIFVWDDPNGENQYAESGAAILYLLVDVPADAEVNSRYPVNFVNVTVSDTNSVAPEFDTVDGSITILDVPQLDPGNVVYNIEDALATPGSTIELPVEVWFDDGTASFSMTFVVPEGFTIDDFTFGDAYNEAGTFTFDPATGVLTWTSNDGSDFVPDPGTLIGTLTLTAADDVAPGEYTVTLTDVVPTNADGATLEYTVNDGVITISELELTIVTDYEILFEEPTRVYYWSHDYRTFAESGGLDGMSAYIYYYQYYVANGYFVDAQGNQILDTNGNAMPYNEADPTYPSTTYAFNAVVLDVTANTKPAEDADSPIEVYVAGQHAYPIALYYDQTGSDIIVGDGSPLFMGEIEIYIGLKGDITLDEVVDTKDALDALKYYVFTTIMSREYNFHEAETDHELAFYLGDVYYTQNYDTKTSLSILQYYVYNTIMGLTERDWTYVVGYDFPDSFFEGTT